LVKKNRAAKILFSDLRFASQRPLGPALDPAVF
jgi:hypothetical protein